MEKSGYIKARGSPYAVKVARKGLFRQQINHAPMSSTAWEQSESCGLGVRRQWCFLHRYKIFLYPNTRSIDFLL